MTPTGVPRSKKRFITKERLQNSTIISNNLVKIEEEKRKCQKNTLRRRRNI